MTIWTLKLSTRIAKRHETFWDEPDASGSKMEVWWTMTPWREWKTRSAESPGEAREQLRYMTNGQYIQEKMGRGCAQVEVFRDGELLHTLVTAVPYGWDRHLEDPALSEALIAQA